MKKLIRKIQFCYSCFWAWIYCCGSTFLHFVWDPHSKGVRSYKEADNWGRDFRNEYLNSLDWSSVEKSEVADFLYERSKEDWEQAEKSYDSLKGKCGELLKLNSALIVGVFALIRFFESKSFSMFWSKMAIIGLLVAIFILWRALAGLPHIPITDVHRLADWERHDKEGVASIKYNAATFAHRATVANLSVNGWVSTRLSLAWLVTLAALVMLAANLFASG